MGLRLAGLMAMLLLILINFQKVRIKSNIAALYFFMCLSFIPGLVVSLIDGVEILDGVKWFFSFYFVVLFVILFFSFEIKIIIDATILAGIFYGLSQLLVLFLFSFDFEFGSVAIDYLQSHAKGWIIMKETFGVTHPFVYLQATLSLVPIAILALYHGKYQYFLFFLLILVLAQSRFGIFVLAIFFCIFYLKSRVIDLVAIDLIYLIPLALLIVLFSMMAGYDPGYYIDDSGFGIRLGHLLSIAKENDILKLLFGFGPGSLYFTIGANDFVDNIEVSQLEHIRKYGLIGSTIFFLPLYLLLRRLYLKKESRSLVMSICSMFVVALSNPVLISITFSWFLAIVIYSLFKTKEAVI